MARTRRKAVSDSEPLERASVWQRFKQRFSLPGIEAWSSTVRTVFLNALFLVAFVVLLPVLVSQFQRDQVVIEPIGVPEALESQGMTDTVAASRVWDGLQDVVQKANTSKASIVAIPDARRVEFSFPDSGFSIESLVFHVRRLFNAYETRIAGEFVCADKNCDRSGLRLRLRVIRNDVDIIDLNPIGTRSDREYFAEAGARILALLDPFVALSALSEDQPLKATTLARHLIRAQHKDAKWAHNLVGLIRQNEGDDQAAIAEFKAAIAIDANFAQAQSNLGAALVRTGDLAGAQRELDALLRREPRNVWALESLSKLAVARNDIDGAVARLIEAAEIDTVNPVYFALAGKISYDHGRRDEAITLLKRSLELDPGFSLAFSHLGLIYLGEDDRVSAEKIYRDAADYAPEDPTFQAAHGQVLALLHRWDEAVVRYERALALAADNAGYWLEYGRCLQRLARLDDAMKALQKAVELAPGNADTHLSLADVYRDQGRKPEAVAAYRKFLDLDKADSPMRPVAEKFIEILSAEG